MKPTIYKISIDGETADRIGELGIETMAHSLLDYVCGPQGARRKRGIVRVRVKGPSHGHAFRDYFCTTEGEHSSKVLRKPEWKW